MELTNDFRVGLPVEEAWAVLTDVERIAPCMPGAQLQEVEGDEYRGVVKVKVGPITAQYKGAATFVDLDKENHVAVLRAEGRETRGQGNANATITATLTPDGDGTAVSVVTDLTVTGRVAQFGRGVLADVSAKLLGQFVDCLETTVLSDAPAPAAKAEAAAPTPTAKAAPATKATKAAPTAKTESSSAPAETAEGAASSPAEAASATEAEGDAAGSANAAPTASGSEPPQAPSAVPAPAGTSPTGARRIDHPETQPVDLISAAGSPVAKRVGPVLAAVAVVWLLKKLLGRRR